MTDEQVFKTLNRISIHTPDGSMGPIPGLPKNPDFVDRHKT